MAEYLCEEDMNTGEYISRDLALRQLNATCLATDCDNYNGVRCRACAYADAMDFIDAIPSADVQPAKHGRWLNHHAIWIDQPKIEGWFVQAKCSECEKWAHVMNPYTKSVDYECCPHCGARMDGDTNDD